MIEACCDSSTTASSCKKAIECGKLLVQRDSSYWDVKEQARLICCIQSLEAASPQLCRLKKSGGEKFEAEIWGIHSMVGSELNIAANLELCFQ
jgi:hypothetical protein